MLGTVVGDQQAGAVQALDLVCQQAARAGGAGYVNRPHLLSGAPSTAATSAKSDLQRLKSESLATTKPVGAMAGASVPGRHNRNEQQHSYCANGEHN